MKAINHPAYKEEVTHLLTTIAEIELRIQNVLKDYGVEDMYAPPDTIRIFSNQASTSQKHCKEALRDLYFGRVDWSPNNSSKLDSFYIGKSPLYPFIIDWRDTLASDLYYNQATRREDGELLLLRTFLIENRLLQDIEDNFQDPSVTGELNPDSMLARILEETRGQLHEIVATINSQQNRIIRAPIDSSLVVQGVPGSGKTVIALHRVSFLLYNYKELRSQNILILGPNPIFMNYMSQVLPSLGDRQIPQKTFDQWVIDQLGEKLKYQSQEDLLEFLLSQEKSNAEKIMHLRNCQNMGSLVMGQLLDRYLELLRDEVIEGKPAFVYRYFQPGNGNQPITVDRNAQQIRAIIDEVKYLPFNQQREAVELKLSNQVSSEIARKMNFPFQEREQRYKKVFDEVSKQVREYFSDWRALNVSVAFRRLFRQRGLLQKLGEGLFTRWDLELMAFDAPTTLTPFRFSDLAALLYFKLLLDGPGETYGHIVIDEAQDIPALFFVGLNHFIPKKSITILGDIGQGIFINNGLTSWQDLFSVFPTLKEHIEELNVCYRSTREVMEYANSMLRRIGTEESKLIRPLNRPGQPIETHSSESEDQWANQIIDCVNSAKKNGWKSIAIICKTSESCQFLSGLLKAQGFSDFQLIENRDSLYKGTITLLPSYLSKGLEFDAVILADGHNYPADSLSTRLLFVSITRAAHQLYVCWQGIISPLLDENLEKVTVEPFMAGQVSFNPITVDDYAIANRLEADWCVEQLARTGRLPLLVDGVIDSVVMDCLIQKSKSTTKQTSEETLIQPLTPDVEEEVTRCVQIWEGREDTEIQSALALAQTVFGLMKNHMRNLLLIPPKEEEFNLAQQIVLLVRLKKLIEDANLSLPGGRWTGPQRLTEDIDRNRKEHHKRILGSLVDYGLIETQTIANSRQQLRISPEWIRDLLEFSLGFSPEGLDPDLTEAIPNLPSALDWTIKAEVSND